MICPLRKKGTFFPGLWILFLVLFCLPVRVPAQTDQAIEFINGNWFNSYSFEKKTCYAIGGVLSFHRPAHVDATIDLHGGFVVPPFGEAHNHNVQPLNIEALIALYLRHGIFYVKNPNNLPRDRAAVLPKINHPASIDAIFSNGGLTGSKGHPAEIAERLIKRGLWTDADGEGGFYYTVESEADLNHKWPSLLATKPEFIKTYLLYSEQYKRRQNDPKFDGWKGLDPSLLPLIVKKAHEAGLRVSTHIENGADFHNALAAGVDEINHMPGFRYATDVEQHPISEFEISEADARLAAKHGTFVVTTLGDTTQSDPELRRQQDALNTRNLGLLLKHNVKAVLGSDAYRSTRSRKRST